MTSHISLASKITLANSIKDIDGNAYDIAYEFRTKAHALIEIEFNSLREEDISQSRIALISNRLPPEAQLQFINRQLNNLLVVVREPSASILPYIWNDVDDRWLRYDKVLETGETGTSPDKRTATLGLFVAVGQNKIVGFILSDVPLSHGDDEVNAFQGIASRLIAKQIAIQPEPMSNNLSRSERLCLVWCASGKTSNEIATILSLSEHTVNHYFTLICSKLGANNRSHAVAKAIKWGLVSLEEIV